MDPKEKIIDELVRDISHIRSEHVISFGIVLKLTEIATKNLSLKQFCDEIIDVIIKEKDFDNSSLMLYDDETDSLNLTSASGSSAIMMIELDDITQLNFNKKLFFSRDDSIAWKAFESQEPFFIEDVIDNPLFKKYDSIVQIGSLFCLPLGQKGVLNLSYSTSKKLSTYQKRDLIIIAQLIQKLLSLNSFVERLSSSHHLIQSLIEGKKLDLRQISQKDFENFWGLEAALLYAPQGIALIEDEIITLVNPSLINLLNEKSNFVGMNIHHTCLNHIYHSLLDSEESDFVHQKEFQLNIHPDKIIFVEAFLHLLLNSTTQKSSYLLFLHDITHQKEITKRLIELEKKEIFSELSNGFAHHFNNILAVVIANIEMSLRDTNIESIKKRLTKIIDPIGYAQNLIKNIQLISTQSYLDYNDNTYLTNSNEFLDEIISITSVKWLDEAFKSGKNIEFIRQYSDLKPVKIHPDHLRSVLINLIINAVDAIPKNGIITIKTYSQNDHAVFEIIDNGAGINHDELEKIFSPFYTTKGMKSSGLGLTVSKEIINGFAGELILESAKDVGTIARVILPYVKEIVEDKIKVIQQNDIELNKIKILYVDDEEGIVETISEMFELDGFNIVTTSSSYQAIEIMNNTNIDILITDLGMPGMNGWEIASHCKKKNPDSYIILATGWGNQLENDFKSKGINCVLPKPYKYEQLKTLILESGKF